MSQYELIFPDSEPIIINTEDALEFKDAQYKSPGFVDIEDAVKELGISYKDYNDIVTKLINEEKH